MCVKCSTQLQGCLEAKRVCGTRSTYDVDNFLWRMENYFCAKGIIDDAVKFYPKFTEKEAQTKLRWLTQ
ncbi:hypothetical protein Gohar_028360 [Gossypium harknessii]|uniref:Uncharacterized protein n=1 Tax=Gossypium harknessii TaxID=34285 RepID=A0A7J9I8D0_9ROSI|nr:hypothetical protein [Gossypium harknessii]